MGPLPVVAATGLHVSTYAVLLFVTLVPSIILHEISHGAAALAFGDPTARDAGRLTLNPIAHIDPFGSLILPALLVLTGAGAFGYAKPVPVRPNNMRSPRNHGLLTSLAGPATNLAIAGVATLLLRVLFPVAAGEARAHFFPDSWPARVLLVLGFGNVLLATFNLIPLPPLDGSALIERVLPRTWWPRYLQLRQYSMGLVLILVFVVPGNPLGHLFNHALNLWERLL